MSPKTRISAAKANDNEFRTIVAAVTFVDLKGYSAMTEAQLKSFAQNFLPELAHSADLEKQTYYNTWGDAVVLATPDPKQAAKTALSIRDITRSFDWKDNHLPVLSARISVHMGSLVTGPDAFSKKGMLIGTGVNLAARIEPCVEPGQVWCTSDFITILARTEHSLYEWSPLGRKDLAKNFGQEDLHVLYRSQESNPLGKGHEVAVTIVQKGSHVLLVRRIDGETPVWQFPAGQIKPGSDPKEAAKRECMEETGISCHIIEKIGERLHPTTGAYLHYFLADWYQGEEKNGDPQENDQVEWVNRADVVSRLTTDIDPRVKRILEGPSAAAETAGARNEA